MDENIDLVLFGSFLLMQSQVDSYLGALIKISLSRKNNFFKNLPFYGLLFTNFIHKKTCRKCLITIKCLADCIMLSKVNRKHEIEEFEMKKRRFFLSVFCRKFVNQQFL